MRRPDLQIRRRFGGKNGNSWLRIKPSITVGLLRRRDLVCLYLPRCSSRNSVSFFFFIFLFRNFVIYVYAPIRLRLLICKSLKLLAFWEILQIDALFSCTSYFLQFVSFRITRLELQNNWVFFLWRLCRSTKRFGPDNKRFEHLSFLNLAQSVVCLIWSFMSEFIFGFWFVSYYCIWLYVVVIFLQCAWLKLKFLHRLGFSK